MPLLLYYQMPRMKISWSPGVRLNLNLSARLNFGVMLNLIQFLLYVSDYFKSRYIFEREHS